jgi:hypothetical protein
LAGGKPKAPQNGIGFAFQRLTPGLQDHQQRLNDLLGQVKAPAECCGAAFAFGGKIAGVDLFDQPATLAKLWPKLVSAYAIDALEETENATASVTAEQVTDWLRSVAEARAESFKSPGLGDDVRLEGSNLVGAGLVVEEHPVHVELFRHEQPTP